MMPITSPPAPEAVTRNALLETAHATRANQPPDLAAAAYDLGGEAAARSTASPPLPVYTIPIEALAAEGPSSASDATHRGWRVLTSDRRGNQLVDVMGETDVAVCVRRGFSADILAQAGKLAETAVSDDLHYEARLIDFGRLGMSALWLHCENAADRFFLLAREPVERSEAELLDEATARARQYLANATDAADEGSDVGG